LLINFGLISKLEPDQNVMVRFLTQMSNTSARTLTKTEIIKNNLNSLQSFKEIILDNINNLYSHHLNKIHFWKF